MTGVPVLGIRAQFQHPALFYAGRADYLTGTMPFIEEALTAGEPVAVAVPKPNLGLVRGALGASADRVLLVDMTEAGANPGRIIPGVLRAFADAHPDRHVRIVGEPIWPGRTRNEYPACAQHEALINLAFADRFVTILCPYDTEGFDRQVLDDARATHPVLIDRAGRHASGQYDPDRIVSAYNLPLAPPPSSAVERVADASTLDDARSFATAHGKTVGLSAQQSVDLEIAVTELLTNSIQHGGGIGTLRIWTENQQLICEISDAGQITDPLAGRRPADDTGRHGRGLLLVNHVADLVRTYTGPSGTTVRIHLRVPSESARDLSSRRPPQPAVMRSSGGPVTSAVGWNHMDRRPHAQRAYTTVPVDVRWRDTTVIVSLMPSSQSGQRAPEEFSVLLMRQVST